MNIKIIQVPDISIMPAIIVTHAGSLGYVTCVDFLCAILGLCESDQDVIYYHYQSNKVFVYQSFESNDQKQPLDPITGQLMDSYETYVELVSQNNPCTVHCIVYTDTMYHT